VAAPEYVFDALIRREQAESEQNRFPFHTEPVFEKIWIQEWEVRNAMRDHVDLAAGTFKDLLQELR